MTLLRQMLLSFQFMTRIPLPFNCKATDKDFAAASMFYAVTSLAVGACMLCVYWLMMFANVALLGAFAAVIAAYFITGALHLDGFADCCDAFFARRPKEDTLRILKDSRMGTFGVLGILFDVGIKTLLIYALSIHLKDGVFLILLSMPVAGKISLMILPALAEYARPEGTGKSMVGNMKPLYICVSLAMSIAVIAIFFGVYAVLLLPLLLAAGAVMAKRSVKRIGGITGDVLGAANEIGEIFFLFVMLAINTI